MRSLRQAASAILVAAVLLALAAPAAAAPRIESASAPAWAEPHLLFEFVAWMALWLNDASRDGAFAPAREAVDDNAGTGASGASDPAGGEVTENTGHAIDPNG